MSSRAGAVLACGALLIGGCARSSLAGQPLPMVTPKQRARCARIEPRRFPARAPRVAAGQVAPPGATLARLCRFAGANARRPLALAGAADVHSRAVVGRLVRDLNRLPELPAVVNCPLDDASAIVLLLAYPRGRSLTVGVGLSGCQVVSGGREHRTAARGNGPALIAELERLVKRGRSGRS